MEKSDQIYVTRAGDTLDNICYKHYGSSSGSVEKVLEANRGLADRGSIFETGTQITLPVIESEKSNEVIRLWS